MIHLCLIFHKVRLEYGWKNLSPFAISLQQLTNMLINGLHLALLQLARKALVLGFTFCSISAEFSRLFGFTSVV